jgi:putative nucleotidyltransferase with HDIG domain
MKYLDRILRSIDYLPPFPVAVARALTLMKDSDVTIDSIADVIKHDQSTASNLLRLCNSSYVGLRRPISNVRDAVVFVGMNHLRRILIITGTHPYFQSYKPGYEARTGELWSHSLAVSLLSSRIERLIPGADSDYVFIASLLHDIGKLVLSEFVTEEYEQIRQMIESEHITFLEAERRVIGTDHADIGSRILTLWRFPEEIVEAVGAHHEPVKPDDPSLTDIVKLSDIMAITMGYGTAVDGLAYNGFAEICRRHGISQGMLDSLSEASIEELTRVESEFGFSGKE